MKKQSHKTKNARNGFTLIELAVVLVIASTLIAGGIMTVVGNRETQRLRNIAEQLQYILKKITDYVDANGFLPCPANPTATFYSSTFGRGLGSGDGGCTASNIVTPGTLGIGALPVYELGISASLTMDAWNNRITYVVDQNLVDTAGFTANDGSINVNNFGRGATTPANITTTAAVLLVSHGPNGFGAWRGRGGARLPTAGAGANELLNTDDNTLFVQSIPGPNFDDLVSFYEKWQLD